MNREKMKQKLAELHGKAPNLFDEIVAEYQDKGAEALEPDLPVRKRYSRTKRTRDVRAIIWAKVEYLKERDGLSAQAAFRKLANMGDTFTQYATRDNRWHVAEEQKPDSFVYSPGDWQDYHKIYNDFDKLDKDERTQGELWLDFIREVADDEWRQRHLPSPEL